MEPKAIYTILVLVIVALIGVIIYLVLRNPYPSCLGSKGKWNTVFKNYTVSSIKDFMNLMQKTQKPDSHLILKDTCASCIVDVAEKNYEPKDFQENLLSILESFLPTLIISCQNDCISKPK
jgi:hypothetical protein